MQVPRESLEDFKIDHAKTAEPPSARSVHLTGRVEVLRPLARSEQLVRFRGASGRGLIRQEPVRRPKGLSWYHRSLAFSGVVAVGASILGIIAGMYAPPEPSLTRGALVPDQETGRVHSYQNDAQAADTPTVEIAPRLANRTSSVRSSERRRPVRLPHYRSASRTRPQAAAAVPHMVVSEFVPTTLIIYVENGEVRMRTETHPTAVHKKKV